jgi:hypothetical protein
MLHHNPAKAVQTSPRSEGTEGTLLSLYEGVSVSTGSSAESPGGSGLQASEKEASNTQVKAICETTSLGATIIEVSLRMGRCIQFRY